MGEAQKQPGHHSLHIEDRAALRATGVLRVEFFSPQLIALETSLGPLRVRGEGLSVESLDHATGELLARGRVLALSYGEGKQGGSLFSRLFR